MGPKVWASLLIYPGNWLLVVRKSPSMGNVFLHVLRKGASLLNTVPTGEKSHDGPQRCEPQIEHGGVSIGQPGGSLSPDLVGHGWIVYFVDLQVYVSSVYKTEKSQTFLIGSRIVLYEAACGKLSAPLFLHYGQR